MTAMVHARIDLDHHYAASHGLPPMAAVTLPALVHMTHSGCCCSCCLRLSVPASVVVELRMAAVPAHVSLQTARAVRNADHTLPLALHPARQEGV